MSEFLNNWFQGFEKGINSLDQNEKEKLFCSCGRNCANSGILKIYQELFLDSGKALDIFFTRLNQIECVAGNVVTPGKVYEISFPRCLCDLHTLGYIHSDCICECSRQSILYVMSSLEPEFEYQVDKLTTVLHGDKECRFRITII
jgi:hypothetical protein